MRWLSQDWTYRARTLVPTSWLTPGRLGDERLWIATEATVARGIAIGLFFGLLLPFGQIVAALTLATVARANLAAAVLATFITNPLTIPLVYAVGYYVGQSIVHQALLTSLQEPARPPASTMECLLVGQVLLASAAAACGFSLARVTWRLVQRRHSKDGQGVNRS
ncbi:MAG: DUF2062 domain-containing protein [Steroidobacteraceae bacterium]|nr:DUF2062 domain-containing protein [Steroidobacteraceae bacterium]